MSTSSHKSLKNSRMELYSKFQKLKTIEETEKHIQLVTKHIDELKDSGKPDEEIDYMFVTLEELEIHLARLLAKKLKTVEATKRMIAQKEEGKQNGKPYPKFEEQILKSHLRMLEMKKTKKKGSSSSRSSRTSSRTSKNMANYFGNHSQANYFAQKNSNTLVNENTPTEKKINKPRKKRGVTFKSNTKFFPNNVPEYQRTSRMG
jgi:hypothetical protein